MRSASYLLLLATILPAYVLALWPRPADYSYGEKFLKVSPNLTIDLVSHTDKERIPSDLQDALSRITKDILTVTTLPLSVDRGQSWKKDIEAAPSLQQIRVTVVELLSAHPGHYNDSSVKPDQSSFNATKPVSNHSKPYSISSRVSQALNTKVGSPDISIDPTEPVPSDLSPLDSESYILTIPADGSTATLVAYTALGAWRGLQSLQQLVFGLNLDPDVNQRDLFISNAPISIKDRPAFPYRGLLLDTSRNYFTTCDIRSLIDGMAMTKLNMFHWHITDTQSWPLKFDKEADTNDLALSQLANSGSYGMGSFAGDMYPMVYTEQDVKDIVAYAGARGINTILEIDMPAHLMSGVVNLNNGSLIACANEKDWLSNAPEPPSGQLNLRPNPDSKGVPNDIQKFVQGVLSRTATLSPSPYLSSGADEPNLNCWGVKNESEIDSTIFKPFMELVSNISAKSGKLGMIWDDIPLRFPETAASLAPGTLVTAWHNSSATSTILDSNHQINIVLAPFDYFYLDCGFGLYIGGKIPTFDSWCKYVSWQKIYSFDPLANLTSQHIPRVFGGEAALWSETMDGTNLHQRAWPRAASPAEIFWTGAEFIENGIKAKRNSTEALQRISELRFRLVDHGIPAEPLQPLWCALRRNQCNWPEDA